MDKGASIHLESCKMGVIPDLPIGTKEQEMADPREEESQRSQSAASTAAAIEAAKAAAVAAKEENK